ncbi:MAG: hypothetical protein V2I27_07690 [Erythrobacter sp.]|jgi:tetratricopeptide (TPR) repeat protein|nr:hypothetical protein [Erythrobacter sp.]
MKTITLRKQASSLALAFALATGTAVMAGALFPAEAHAQKRKKGKDKDAEAESASKPQYSKEFIEAYQPVNTALNAEGADAAALMPQVRAVIPLANSPDEKLAGGGLVYNAGIKAADRAVQLEGMQIMLSSGKVPAEQIGQYNFIAYQLASALNQFGPARTYLQGAIDANFTNETIGTEDLQIAMAESYFANEEFVAGLDYLGRAIENRKEQGLAVDERWYRRGITIAYQNEIVPQIYDVATMWIAEFPSQTNWRDAINLARNLNNFESPEMLDLLRLSRRLDALTEKNDYIYYIEAADARRLPLEVKEVIEEGYASGAIGRDDTYVAESLSIASGRIASDQADLPALERDAGAADAGLRTVVAAGNAFLSYGQHSKAVRFFEKALGMPGVDTNEVLTRLGIAQVGTGDYAAAQATFAKVTGNRMPIARLWAAYADAQGSGTSASAMPSASAAGI